MRGFNWYARTMHYIATADWCLRSNNQRQSKDWIVNVAALCWMCHHPIWEQAAWHIVSALSLYSAQSLDDAVALFSSVVGPEDAAGTTLDVSSSSSQRRTSISSDCRYPTSAPSVWWVLSRASFDRIRRFRTESWIIGFIACGLSLWVVMVITITYSRETVGMSQMSQYVMRHSIEENYFETFHWRTTIPVRNPAQGFLLTLIWNDLSFTTPHTSKIVKMTYLLLATHLWGCRHWGAVYMKSWETN